MSELKLPWRIAETRAPAGIEWDCIIRDADNNPVASVGISGWDKKSAKRHAEMIVDAVNNSTLLSELVGALEGILEDDSKFASLEKQRANWEKRMDTARAALQKARGV